MRMFRNAVIMIKQEGSNVFIYGEQDKNGNWKLYEKKEFKTLKESMQCFNELSDKCSSDINVVNGEPEEVAQ